MPRVDVRVLSFKHLRAGASSQETAMHRSGLRSLGSADDRFVASTKDGWISSDRAESRLGQALFNSVESHNST